MLLGIEVEGDGYSSLCFCQQWRTGGCDVHQEEKKLAEDLDGQK